jgi:hypothetical protein
VLVSPAQQGAIVGSEPMAEHAYEVRVSGLLATTEVLEDLGEVEMAAHDVTTVLSGRFADQAALSDFLRLLRAHGLEVLEIRRVVEDTREGPAEDVAEDIAEGVGEGIGEDTVADEDVPGSRQGEPR